ncbi:hypothetical protein SLE2022_112550 [Rubroshorea leprosula]
MADSSFFRILLFIFLSILGLALISLLSQKSSSWTLISTVSDTNVVTVKTPPSISERREEALDLPPDIVDGNGGSEEANSKDAVPNNLASMPVAAEALQVQNFNETDEASQINATGSSMKDSPGRPLNTKRPRVRTNLDRLEIGLQQARAAIRAAMNGSRVQDPDYIPTGPSYLNAKAFHRSYLEMEKRFKIFVYKEGDPPLFHDGPCYSLYTTEGIFIHKMQMDIHFQTQDPEKAHVFFLPYSMTRMRRYVREPGKYFDGIGNLVQDYVNVIARKHHYFNRSLGTDHFMLSCHDWAPFTSFYSPLLGENSIRALCNANTSERFNPVKDVSIPELNLMPGRSELGSVVGGPSPSQRRILAFFAGGNHGPVRPLVFKQWENKDPDIQIHNYVPKGVSYQKLMRNSKFCLCPSGYEVASPRIVESLYNGCVPVLISKGYVPPFSDVLNWKMFAVTVSLEDIPNLKKILLGISDSQYIRMHRRGVQLRRHFQANTPPKRFDLFHMILHSIWLRRLNTRIGKDLDAVTN